MLPIAVSQDSLSQQNVLSLRRSNHVGLHRRLQGLLGCFCSKRGQAWAMDGEYCFDEGLELGEYIGCSQGSEWYTCYTSVQRNKTLRSKHYFTSKRSSRVFVCVAVPPHCSSVAGKALRLVWGDGKYERLAEVRTGYFGQTIDTLISREQPANPSPCLCCMLH